MRKKMVDRVFELGELLGQSSKTIHLAVVYIDLLIQDENLMQKYSQNADLISCTCLLLGSKFDELDDNIPLIDEFMKATQQTSNNNNNTITRNDEN